MFSIFFLLIMNYKITTIILSILSVVLLATTIYYANNPQVEYRETIKNDTIIIKSVDTITVTKKDIIYKENIILDTIYIKDTALLLEQKIYQDTISTVYFQGINAEIDSIKYKLTKDTVQIFTEKIQTVKEKDNFFKNRFTISAGVFAGYGLINRKADVFVGVGCAVRLY